MSIRPPKSRTKVFFELRVFVALHLCRHVGADGHETKEGEEENANVVLLFHAVIEEGMNEDLCFYESMEHLADTF